tara:strand:+ start:3749 stop:4345 length:597 start_codon:yes stop_codon:yes gene_type:complete
VLIEDNKSIYENYLVDLINCLKNLNLDSLDLLFNALIEAQEHGRTVFLCGNGGSGGNANHIANDLLYPISKKFGLGIIAHSLSLNPSTITCLGNDEGYTSIFSYQLAVQAKKDDILIVLSGSGNSENILEALKLSKSIGMKTFSMLGFDGGEAKKLTDTSILFHVNDMQIAEDMQLICLHMLVKKLYDHFSKVKSNFI